MTEPPGPGQPPPQHSDQHICRFCGKTTTLVWEQAGQTRQLIRIEGDFYERISKKAPYTIEIVCNSCGKAQNSPLQS